MCALSSWGSPRPDGVVGYAAVRVVPAHCQGGSVVNRFMAVVVIDDRTARVVCRGSRDECVRAAGEYAQVLESFVLPARF